MLSNLKDYIKNIDYNAIAKALANPVLSDINDKLYVNDYKEILFQRYRPMSLTAEEEYFVGQKHYPFSHNPAHLSWIYLPLKNGTARQYFSESYKSNKFMEDTLDGNFTYDGTKSVPVTQ
jgi:hypothetical protein